MTLIEWTNEFVLGVPDVDREHRELIELINTLHAGLYRGDSRRRVVERLGEMHALIAAHFAHEEAFMREIRYMAYAEHKEDHEILLDDLRDIIAATEAAGQLDHARLSADLDYWFSAHFRTHDARLHGKKPY